MVEHLLWGWVLGAYSKPYSNPLVSSLFYTYVTVMFLFGICFEGSSLFDPIRIQKELIDVCLSAVSLRRHWSTKEAK